MRTPGSIALLLTCTSTSQSGRENSAERFADIPRTVAGNLLVGLEVSLSAPASMRHGRRRLASSFRIGALAARMWAGVVCMSLPSKSQVHSWFVSF